MKVQFQNARWPVHKIYIKRGTFFNCLVLEKWSVLE